MNDLIKTAEATIILNYQTEKEAEAILKSLSPDNICLQPNSNIESTKVGVSVQFYIRCSRIETLLATVDDLLMCLHMAEETINLIEKNPNKM